MIHVRPPSSWPPAREVIIARPPLNLVLIGAPGSGKGTQASRLCERYRLASISTGEILRVAVMSGSPLGRQVKGIMESGGLVDDDTMVALVRARLGRPDTAPGFVLDGFPRTIAQAQILDDMLAGRPLGAIALTVPTEELERRLDSRRMCLKCRAIYSGSARYGSEAEVCSRCGLVLVRRDDDNLETIRTRLATYRATVQPLLDYYSDRAVLTTVDGAAPPDAVTRALFQHIEDGR